MRSLELFSGAGGLALGIAKAGFKHEAVLDWNKDAMASLRDNQIRGVKPVTQWPLYKMDVSKFNYSSITEDIDLLAGGPPCQPFSLGGKHRGHGDERNLFPEVFRAVRELCPKVILIENVKGLMRSSFANYFSYIILQLTHPNLIRKKSESWMDHLSRLERFHSKNGTGGLSYKIIFRLLKAADYGIPQRRERVFIVGFRSDLGIEWSFPEATHSWNALLWEQWVTGEYWKGHNISKNRRPPIPEKLKTRLKNLETRLFPPIGKPWKTVRDAISGLPDPEKHSNSIFLNHSFNPGARVYKGHTGSPLDEPAKTLKAGDHGVPGGENMIAFPDGQVRYFTVREAARLQTFPDDFSFKGSWTETMRQLGNAVPVSLAEIITKKIKQSLQPFKQVN